MVHEKRHMQIYFWQRKKRERDVNIQHFVNCMLILSTISSFHIPFTFSLKLQSQLLYKLRSMPGLSQWCYVAYKVGSQSIYGVLSQSVWIWIPLIPLNTCTTCGNFSKLLNHSKPQFLHFWNVANPVLASEDYYMIEWVDSHKVFSTVSDTHKLSINVKFKKKQISAEEITTI